MTEWNYDESPAVAAYQAAMKEKEAFDRHATGLVMEALKDTDSGLQDDQEALELLTVYIPKLLEARGYDPETGKDSKEPDAPEVLEVWDEFQDAAAAKGGYTELCIKNILEHTSGMMGLVQVKDAAEFLIPHFKAVRAEKREFDEAQSRTIH